jgi:hypothetical protein
MHTPLPERKRAEQQHESAQTRHRQDVRLNPREQWQLAALARNCNIG